MFIKWLKFGGTEVFVKIWAFALGPTHTYIMYNLFLKPCDRYNTCVFFFFSIKKYSSCNNYSYKLRKLLFSYGGIRFWTHIYFLFVTPKDRCYRQWFTVLLFNYTSTFLGLVTLAVFHPQCLHKLLFYITKPIDSEPML